MQHDTIAAEQPQRLSRRDTTVITVLLVSTFVVFLNETAMNVALERIMVDLDITERLAQWLTTAFLLTMAVVIPVTGWLLQRLDTKPVYITAMSLFIAGTVIAVVSTSFPILLVGRIVQAGGTAIMLPLLMTTVMTLVPVATRGRIMGLISLVMSCAPALGPTVSGAILQFLNWRFVFVLVLPIAIAAAIIGTLRIQNVSETSRPSLDLLSVPLSAFGFGGLIVGLSLIGDDTAAAWQLPVSLGVGVVALAAFIGRQPLLQRRDRALLDLRTFAHPIFTLSAVIMFLGMMSMLGTMIMLPLVLQKGMHMEPLAVGLIMLPGALIMGLLGPVVGRLYDRHGPRVLMVPGALVVLAALVGFSFISIETPWWAILLGQMMLCLGLAFVFPPLFTTSLGALPPRLYSHGSAMVGTVQQVAGAAGTAMFVTVMAWQSASLVDAGGAEDASLIGGARLAFLGAAILWVAGVIATLFIRKPEDHPEDVHGDLVDAGSGAEG